MTERCLDCGREFESTASRCMECSTKYRTIGRCNLEQIGNLMAENKQLRAELEAAQKLNSKLDIAWAALTEEVAEFKAELEAAKENIILLNVMLKQCWEAKPNGVLTQQQQVTLAAMIEQAEKTKQTDFVSGGLADDGTPIKMKMGEEE